LLKDILDFSDKIFTIVFALEALLKLVGYGYYKYFTDGWCWLDFIIVVVAVAGISSSLIGLSEIEAFKVIRTLRALRPLRALSRFEGVRVSEFWILSWLLI
jgi:hypothetical protein